MRTSNNWLLAKARESVGSLNLPRRADADRQREGLPMYMKITILVVVLVIFAVVLDVYAERQDLKGLNQYI